MLQIIRVRGNSIAPYLTDGDFAVILKSRWMRRPPVSGEYIVFHEKQYGTLIKRVHTIHADGGLEVRGTDDFSTDSRLFGAIVSEQIIGKVIWCIKRKK